MTSKYQIQTTMKALAHSKKNINSYVSFYIDQ